VKKFLVLILLFTGFLFLFGCSKTITLTYVIDGETYKSIEVKKEEELTLEEPTQEGYDFSGWFLDEGLTNKNTSKSFTKDTTLYGEMTIAVHMVSFVDSEDRLIGKVQEVEHGRNAVPPTPPVKEGYTFKGWDQPLINITKDVTIKALYDVNKYEVKFYDATGKVIDTQEVEYGKSAEAPSAPTKEGYTFKEWDQDYTFVKGNLIVKPVFEANKYTVKFVDAEGNTIDTQEVEYGKSAEAPSAPTKEGYQFVGWDKDYSVVESNLTITAKYEKAKFLVEFLDFDGKRIGEQQTVEYGKSAEAPSAPIKEGYTFKNWDKDYTVVKTNLTIKPNFDYINYDIKYYDNNTLVEDITKTTYNVSEEVVLSTYEKDGFIFVGWFTTSSFQEETKIDKIVKGSTGEVIVYGKWLDSSKTYTVNYELNGGAWSWEVKTLQAPAEGIDGDSDLPELFMQDYYMYLKTNNLLTSSVVATSLHKTNWADFSKNYVDPYAIYNHTTTNTSKANDGYSQFFYDTATGDATTGQILSIEGGFFGTEPYKTKYANLAQHLAIMLVNKYTGYNFWDGAESKTLMGFILDGYFYGTQGLGDGMFAEYRQVVPTTTTYYMPNESSVQAYTNDYEITTYVQGLKVKLVAPVKVGYAFAGWYTSSDFSGEAVTEIDVNVTPAEKYYAKWIEIE